MANTAYVGAGTTLGTSYYMRRFYAANADARTTTSRSNLTNSTPVSYTHLTLPTNSRV